MATLEQVIDSVRRAVSDYDPPRRFDSSYYEDAIQFALSKLSHDYSEQYLDVPSVPFERVFLLRKLATIQMCYERAQAAETSSNDPDSDGDIEAVASVSVPDLAVTKTSKDADDTSDRWLKIAEDLQAEYDGELEHDGGQSLAAEVEVGVVNRKSMKHGGYASRKLDQGLPAVSVSATVDGANVNLVWTKLFSDLFMQYEVYRSVIGDFSDEEQVAVVGDNHINEYTDEAPGFGTYYYRVYTVNPNGIKTPSNNLMIEVV